MQHTLAFVDTETTGLDPERHEIWEVALILATPPDADGKAPAETSRHWMLRPRWLEYADPMALSIGRFYERTDGAVFTPVEEFAAEFARLTARTHLVGAVPSFDAIRLERLLRTHGFAPSWHYHLVDVEALAAGNLALLAAIQPDRMPKGFSAEPPWDSNVLSRALGVDPAHFDRHTAMGDVEWAQAIYEAVMT